MNDQPAWLLGAHFSIARGFVAAGAEAVRIGANALQIFLKSPRSGGQSKLTAVEAAAYRGFAATHALHFLVGHCSYLLNFAKNLETKNWVLENLVDDLRGVEQLGGVGVILHVGKHLELSRADGIRFVVENIRTILAATKNLRVKILLENTAGQGTELGCTFDELATIFHALDHDNRVGFCLDTCHAFAAGYDLRDEASIAKTFREFDKKLGLKNLTCIHFNDAKTGFGKRVDRHANLGMGEIGKTGLTVVARFAIQKKIPLILETPEDELWNHAREIGLLREWLA